MASVSGNFDVIELYFGIGLNETKSERMVIICLKNSPAENTILIRVVSLS